jgi:hypothetical protein
MAQAQQCFAEAKKILRRYHGTYTIDTAATTEGPGIDCTPGEAKFRNKWGDEAMAQLAAELQSESPSVVAAPPLPTRTFRRLGR